MFAPILNYPYSLTKNIPVTHPGLQLLRKGQVGLMLSEQENLPRLPINDLESAIEDFLRASEPLLSPEQFAQTKAQAEEFLKEDGPRLHELLVGYDKEDGRNSYLEVVHRWLVFQNRCATLTACHTRHTHLKQLETCFEYHAHVVSTLSLPRPCTHMHTHHAGCVGGRISNTAQLHRH